MRISTRLTDFLYRRFGWFHQPIERVALLDKAFRVVKGSIRAAPDYDDAWLLALAFNSNVVFDIGCNIGQTSLIMLCVESIQQVIMVDPNPKALAIAAENMFLNRFSHKTNFVCAFVAETMGDDILFFTTGTGAAGSMYSSHAESASQLGSSFSVPTVSVDWLCERRQCVPDLIKIDVEGAEAKVLHGAPELAKKRRTKFLVEMHSNANLSMRANAERVLDWCAKNGYAAWYLKEKKSLQSSETIEHRGRCHVLLLPQGDDFPDYLRRIEQGAALADAVNALNRQ